MELLTGDIIIIGEGYAKRYGFERKVILLLDGVFEEDNGLYCEDVVCPAIYNEKEGEYDSVYHLFGNDLENFMDCKIVRGEPVYVCDTKRHIVCVPYSVPGLHAMAEELNIKRCWYHAGRNPHYDTPKTRCIEVTSNCNVLASPRQLLQIIKDAEMAIKLKK